MRRRASASAPHEGRARPRLPRQPGWRRARRARPAARVARRADLHLRRASRRDVPRVRRRGYPHVLAPASQRDPGDLPQAPPAVSRRVPLPAPRRVRRRGVVERRLRPPRAPARRSPHRLLPRAAAVPVGRALRPCGGRAGLGAPPAAGGAGRAAACGPAGVGARGSLRRQRRAHASGDRPRLRARRDGRAPAGGGGPVHDRQRAGRAPPAGRPLDAAPEPRARGPGVHADAAASDRGR